LKESDGEGNKISRRHFLKLLGAGAIGYLAYKSGFINYLLLRKPVSEGRGYTGGWAAVAAGTLDEDGIVMMTTPKSGGYSYKFDITKDPAQDRRLDIHDTGKFEFKKEGGIKFIRFMSHNPGSGTGSNTARFHIFTEDKADEDKQKYNWKNGSSEIGWLTKPNDLRNGEWTFICRPNKILNSTDSITAKLGGGRHSLKIPRNEDASCWNVHWAFNASIENAVSFEFNHPEYEHGHTVKVFNRYKPLGDKWFGCKVVSMVRPDKSARDIITYFNEDPLDGNTGKPKNDGWKKYFEFTHTGQGNKYRIPHSWGGAKSTWRNDSVTSIDVAYMNHREISTFTNIK
jgi:hypothetical protein